MRARIYPAPGSVVSVSIDGTPYHHVAIVAEPRRHRLPNVISFYPEGVFEQKWEQFSAGRQVTSRGYPGGLHPREVLHRARLRRPKCNSEQLRTPRVR
jgi:hypothetical protein